VLRRASRGKSLQFFPGEDHANHMGGEALQPDDLGQARLLPNTADFLGFRLVHLISFML
jgi:hypothetical protein